MEETLIFSQELKDSYDLLDLGILLVKSDFTILYKNAWLRNKLAVNAPESQSIEGLFGSHKFNFLLSKLKQVFKFKTIQYLSPTLHPWIIPVTDQRLPDNLMRQKGLITPVSVQLESEQIENCAMIQVRDVSNLVTQLGKLKDVLKEKRILEKELSTKNQELEKSFARITEQQDILQLELQQAKKTQLSILPLDLPVIEGATIGTKYLPMEQIGGDFYNILSLGDDKYALLVADVTGHGVPAALISFMVSGIFYNCVSHNSDCESVFKNMNKQLLNTLEEGKFVSMIYAVYNSKSKELTYTTGGHPAAIVVRAKNKEVFYLDTGGVMVGILPEDLCFVQEKRFQLEPGDKILFYTDGIIEATNPEGEMYSEKRLTDFWQQNNHLPVQDSLEKLCDELELFTEHQKATDDITMVGLEIKN